MKARIKLEARFSWVFAEIEYNEVVQEKLQKFTKLIKDRLLSVIGFEPSADINWSIEIQQPKLYEFNEVMEMQEKE